MLVLWVAPYSLFFTLYSLLLTLSSFLFPPSSSFLLFPPYPPYSSYLLSVKPPYNSDMKRVSCSENVNFVR